MKVTIDGIEYLPVSEFGNDANQTARAIIGAFIGGWYNTPECGKDGGAPKEHCDCSGCHIYRVAVRFLGDIPSGEEKEPGFKAIYKATDV